MSYQIDIREYDVYYPEFNYAHSKYLAQSAKFARKGVESQNNDSDLEIEQRIYQNRASLEDFERLFKIDVLECAYVAQLAPVQRGNVFNNLKTVYKATNALRRSVSLFDDAIEYVGQCLTTQKGKVATLFARMYELIAQAFKIIETVYELRKAQQAPVFADLYDYLKHVDVFKPENTLYIFKIMRSFGVFHFPRDDSAISLYVGAVEDLSLKMLLGIGKLGKLMHVGILRMLSAKCALSGRGRYYYELLGIEDKIVQRYDAYVAKAQRDGLRVMTVSCRNYCEILDMFPELENSASMRQTSKCDEYAGTQCAVETDAW